jgi:phosphohistidine phosphatase SixA
MQLLKFLSFLLAITLTACSTTTVYLVRHAEKVDESDSTDLSPAGKQRALALADTLASRGIDSIFTTPYRRTRQTAEPLAQRLGMQSRDYAPKPTGAIVNRVNQIRGKTVLVVGHSNTVLEIARGLGAKPRLPTIEAGDFDNLFVVRIKRGPLGRRVGIAEKTYGAVTRP